MGEKRVLGRGEGGGRGGEEKGRKGKRREGKGRHCCNQWEECMFADLLVTTPVEELTEDWN